MGARNSIVTIHRSHLQGWGKPIPESQCCLWGAGAQGCSLLPIEGGLLGCTTRGTKAPLGPAPSLADAVGMGSGETTRTFSTTS